MKNNDILNLISKNVMNGIASNDDLVQIIEHAGSFLNLKTRSAYAKENNISYNAAKKYRQNKTIFGVTLIIDNE